MDEDLFVLIFIYVQILIKMGIADHIVFVIVIITMVYAIISKADVDFGYLLPYHVNKS